MVSILSISPWLFHSVADFLYKHRHSKTLQYLLSRIQVEPAKPFEKKSELTKKLSLQPGGAGGTLTKLPPINNAAASSKAPEKGVGGLNETKNGAAYQVNKKNKNKKYFLL